MKKITSIAFLVLLTIISFGQNAMLKGKISDKLNDESLPGATIVLDETSTGTSSDLQGKYSFSLPAGKHVIQYRFIGYRDTTISIDLGPGETQVIDIKLTSEYTQLQGVTITGNLQGQAKALNQQKAADNIKNVVSADQIGRFPDPNAAEALQRVSGVNIERDQGEGRYVLVRGLSPKFTNISVNGEQIPSPEADVRFVALDAIPSDQLSSMEVTKALTPDMDGDAIGGSVNLITRMAETQQASINGSAIIGYNNLMQRPNLQGSFQFGKRFLKGEKLGILLNSSYYSNNLGSDNWEREPFDNELELRDYELTRTRRGFSTTIDYKINENNQLYARALLSEFTDREWRRGYLFVPEDGEIGKFTKDRFESQSINTFNVGAKHIYPGFQLDYEAQYSFAEQDTPYDNEVGFIAGIDNTTDWTNTEYPSFAAEGYLDNSLYEFDALEMGTTNTTDENITAKVNVGIPYKRGKNDGIIKFGSKVRFKEKQLVINQNVYENLGGVPNLNQFQGGLLDDNFLGGRFQLSEFADIPTMITYFNNNPSQFELQAEDKAIDEAVEAFEANENVYAAYAMARQQIDKLTFLGGVRYERTTVTYRSSDVIINGEGDLEDIIPVEGGTTYDFVLPQFHAKYAMNSNTNLRAAATWSYARPNFAEIVPAQEANLQDREANVGNPDLLPVSAINLDLLGERYFKNVGVISGGIFLKQLDDFIYSRNLFNSQYPLISDNPVATNIRVTQAQNGETAQLFGSEIAYQQRLTFLPGFLSKLSVYFNYTFTTSRAEIQDRENAEDDVNALETITLPGQAAHIGNVALAYESRKLSLRAAINFNGEYLAELGGDSSEDLFIANRMQLDFTGSYTLTEHFRVFVEVLNITNQPFESYIGSKDIVNQREFYGWWSRAGLKFNF